MSVAARAVREAAILPVRAYRVLISPLLPARCRFEPTCSSYAVEAILMHGTARGTMLALWRVVRCQPWSRGGYDPVPSATR